jgi:Flp pilus assembly protein TadG
VARNDRGAAAVEFALVLPLLVMLFAGIAELGRIYYLQAMLSGAAREGALVMALQNNTATAVSAAKTAAGSVALSDTQILVTPATGACRSTTTPVQASVTITFATPLVSAVFGTPPVKVHGYGVMQCGG